MYTGLIDLPWWGYVVVTLVLTQITIACVTIFLHRHQAHRALDLHPIPSYFFSLLAVVGHRRGYQGVGVYPPQTSRKMRDCG